ncbi:aminotransferase class I/II-fold pyridoxal phosphate-dependent enzyme [Caldithrix abyssi]
MIQDYFKLKSLKAAKVSEISEATSAAPVKAEERVNFHIGHPIQDERLIRAFGQLVFQIKDAATLSDAQTFKSYLRELRFDDDLIEKILFVFNSLPSCVPYMARGGYSWRNPTPLIRFIQDWLENGQLETLLYDTGRQNGQKELMLGSGGLNENLRILFFTLNQFLERLPATILLFNRKEPACAADFSALRFQILPQDEMSALELISHFFNQQPERPHFLILGSIPSEHFRRQARQLALRFPLFIVEVNDAPNHLSLAREALLEQRVLRFLTPAVFRPQLKDLSTIIVAGRSDYIQHLETIHFQLKGTPSAPEAELLYFLLKKNAPDAPAAKALTNVGQESDLPSLRTGSGLIHRLERRLENVSRHPVDLTSRLLQTAQQAQQSAQRVIHRRLSFSPLQSLPDDAWAGETAWELIQIFFDRLDHPQWAQALEERFLDAFVAVHPQYDRNACLAVSGSARTALGILGFHGPLKKVITFDLGWTYEHCFPQVRVLPINPMENFSSAEVIEEIQKVIETDADFLTSGALIVNNPHNATGALIPQKMLEEIFRWAINKGLYLIDDLSYQNVGPWPEPRRTPTARQIINKLIKKGLLHADAVKRLITCHSLSKTDSFAGARLTVLEIPDPALRSQFEIHLKEIKPHRLPLLIAYLFYRSGREKVESYWHFRNQLFAERMATLQRAMDELPGERNPFKIRIQAPQGSMYPLMIIEALPAGISLDSLSTILANQGVGLAPLTTFARTAAGYQMARKAFRLTLGGHISGEKLYYQTRRVLIDLNRIIAQEASLFQKALLISEPAPVGEPWQPLLSQLKELALQEFEKHSANDKQMQESRTTFQRQFLPERLQSIRAQFHSRFFIWQKWLQKDSAERQRLLREILENEFYKDDLSRRQQRFFTRLFDRTVHPTQIFSIQVDQQARQIIDAFLTQKQIAAGQLQALARALLNEFIGRSVPINSIQESDELLLDLDSLNDAELLAALQGKEELPTFLSYWGDWDGSSRPSGQGHRLIAAVLLKNVARMARILELLLKLEPDLKIDAALNDALVSFPQRRKKFWQLLNQITHLTNQLEKRYRSLSPASVHPSRWRKIGMKLHLVPDPLTVLWQHNDRLERKMLQLRQQRRSNLEYYFQLNKQLRKTLRQHLHLLLNHLGHPELFYRLIFYRDLLKRFALTPRIHQNMITAHDPFAIDTTVFNLTEINELGARFGNPGLILALQISMCSRSDAIIKVEQKLRARREAVLRNAPELPMPFIRIIPLFEEIDVVKNIEGYLDELWAYVQTHHSTSQSVENRLREMLCEIFVAGSDLSQQVSQTVASHLYKETRFKVVRWLARKGLAGQIRLKLGSGEPMQRQGGFYDDRGSLPAFTLNRQNRQRLFKELNASSARACDFAVTPLRGVISSGDLRTFQSTISEKIRMISAFERANFLFHYKNLQTYFEKEIVRASEPLVQTRLRFGERGEKELKRLTLGWTDPLFEKFLQIRMTNFKQIVYGREEDIVGIHLASYFISRMVPAFRDRPTVRPGRIQTGDAGQRVIERLSRVLPQAKHGTMLRAIGHNRAQTMILGIAQLTTGLFRALKEFVNEQQGLLSQQLLLQERILPHLPVYEILKDLRLYQDIDLKFWSRLEPFFPPGNSAVSSLREDMALINEFVPLFQKELIRRHGLPVADFFENGHFKINLLPALRPDLAVLLQPDLFNKRPEKLFGQIEPPLSPQWQMQVQELLEIPVQITHWRTKIWGLIEQKVAMQVESFVQLAQAIMHLMKQQNSAEQSLSQNFTKFQRNFEQVSSGLQALTDENLKQFLLAALQYLTSSRQEGSEVPIHVMRALHDVERIVRIESQPLTEAEQQELRFYILQIARLTGENG